MRNDAAVASAIERIVAGAGLPGRAAREDLRRELETHFEEACAEPDSAVPALVRFGDETAIAGALRRIYRRDAALVSAARIAASIVASMAAAVLIEAAVHLRVELAAAVWRLAPGFSYAGPMAAAVAFALVAVREATRPMVDRRRATAAVAACAVACAGAQAVLAGGMGAFAAAALLAALSHLASTLTRGSASWLVTFAAFAAAEYGLHAARSLEFGLARALAAGAVLVAVWASTRLIAGRVDRVFVRVLETA